MYALLRNSRNAKSNLYIVQAIVIFLKSGDPSWHRRQLGSKSKVRIAGIEIKLEERFIMSQAFFIYPYSTEFRSSPTV